MLPSSSENGGRGIPMDSPTALSISSKDTTGSAAFEHMNTTKLLALETSRGANFVEKNTIVLRSHDGDGYVLPYLPWDASPSTRPYNSVTDPMLVNKSPDRGDIQASTPRATSGCHQGWQLQYTGREPKHYLAEPLGANRQAICNFADQPAVRRPKLRYHIPVPLHGRFSLCGRDWA